MKKIAILGLCAVLLLAVCAYSAAADVTVMSVFNKDNPTFGGSSQKATNPNADDDDDRVIHVTGIVTLSNNGTSDITVASIGITPKTTLAGQTFTILDLNITLPAAVEILAGGSASLTLNAKIPKNLHAVDKNLRESGFNIADIILKDGGGAGILTFNAYMQRENNLRFDKVYVNVGEESNSVDDDDNVKDVKPGDHVEVEATVESRFDNDDDLDIEDVEFLVLIDDHDLDVDEDEDMGDIGPGDEETESVDFDVEDDVDDGSYDMEITVEGEDENGAMHGERMNIEFEVEKKRHELKIDSISVVPSSVECGDSLDVKVKITNIGKSDEDEITIRVMNEDINVDTLVTNIELDEGDSSTKTVDVTIPSDVSTGTKSLTVITYYDFNEESNRDVTQVEVTCSADEEDEEEEDEEDETGSQDTTPPTTSSGGTTTAQDVDDSASDGPVTTVSDSGDDFRNSTFYILLLVLAIIVIVIIGAVLVVKLMVVR